jgi:hypothetical protein
MDDQELHKLLEQLHIEIEHIHSLDENERQLLRQLDTDIKDLLEKSESDPLLQAHPNTLHGLEDSINYFELSHPTLTSQLTKLLSILSNSGI